jgi:acyl-CoA synthetase (AMP-forming)/AMP-acid ligase II
VGIDRYIGDPAASAECFRNGFFYPGDQGALTADGLLIVSGRQADKLNIGGTKTSAERIEAILGGFPPVAEAAVFGAVNARGVEEVWAAIVWRGKADPETLRTYCRSRMQLPLVPAHIVSLDALPATDNGKLDRRRVREVALAVARSTLEAAASAAPLNQP